MKKITGFFALIISIIMLALTFETYAVSGSLVSAKVVEIKSINNCVGAVELKWNEFPGAQQYELFRKNDSGKWEKIAQLKTGALSYKDKNVKNSVVYSYRIRAVLSNGYSGYAKTSYMYLAAPTITKLQNKNSGIYVKWKKCTVATGYKVYRKAGSDGKWKCIATINGNTPKFTDADVKSGTKYKYKVKQVCGSYISGAKTQNTSNTFIAAPNNVKAVNSPNGVVIQWEKVPNCKGYTIYRKVQGGKSYKKIADYKGGNKISYIDKKTAYGKKNSYKVQAYAASKKSSAFSAVASLFSVDPNKPMVALTYDDGPYRPVTERILDTLDKYCARATFFVVGSRLNTYSDCLKKENKQGCEIACHTFNHTTLTTASDNTVKTEIAKTNDLVKMYTGQTVKLVRAPGGAVNQKVKNLVGYPLINWSVDTLDWKSRNAKSVIDNIKSNVSDGSIVLMHDLYASTAEASETIIPWLVKKGYQLVTVSEMMDAKGINMQKGGLYTRAG